MNDKVEKLNGEGSAHLSKTHPASPSSPKEKEDRNGFNHVERQRVRLTDSFNRVHDYLRISLTDNCNLRCFYCMPEEDYDFTPASRLMQPDEIETLAKLLVANGVKKIRLTGGEPLVRKDAGKIISALGRLPVELAITTNGTRIHEFLSALKEANIRTINISLDTLQPDKFLLVTRRDLFHQVRSNIELLLHHQCKNKCSGDEGL